MQERFTIIFFAVETIQQTYTIFQIFYTDD